MEERPDLRGRRLGDRYELEGPIASGGMAAVWRARDIVLGRAVAVKILRDDLAADPDLLERFRIEAVAAARLSHPAVVRVFDTGVDDGVAYIVMELFEGTTLSAVLEEDGPVPPPDAVRLMIGALAGLAHAHAHDVVHRDVKPGNILVDDTGLVKVTDFGIAKAAFAQGDVTTTGNLLGTAKYLAPEQAAGHQVDARADLYAAGVVLYELLTGRAPFEGDTHIATATMRLSRDPMPPGALRPGIPRALEAVVLRALARDPEARFQTAEEMSSALERSVAPSRRRAAFPSGAPAQRPPSLFRSWILAPVIVVLLTGMGIGAFLVFEQLRDGPDPAGGEGNGLRRLPVEAAFDHDPEGDGSENEDDVALAVDGDRDTGWETEGYNSEDLGGLKPGVGIAMDLGEPREVERIELVTALPGWRFELRGSDNGEEFSEPIPDSEGETSLRATPQTAVDLEPSTFRYYLVWITRLAQDDRYRAQVAEMSFFGPRE